MSKAKPEEVLVNRTYYVHFNFTLPQVMAIIEFECKQHDARDRTLIPEGWDLENVQDVYGACSVCFSKTEGGPFADEEIERMRLAIEGVERAYWELTK